MKVYVFGAGKVGGSLARALRRGGAQVTLRARRRGWPKRSPKADLVVIAVRDGDLAEEARALADRRPMVGAVVHCAGALDKAVLSPLSEAGVAVGQLHPLISVATPKTDLTGAFAHIGGDGVAVRQATEAARLCGMRPFTVDGLDHELYHACAALLANGAAAVAATAATGMERAGCNPDDVAGMLGTLLVSVGRNIQAQGLPHALTGPVRRGDVAAIRAHLGCLEARAPALRPLYLALAAAQLPLAKSLGDGQSRDFRAIATELARDTQST